MTFLNHKTLKRFKQTLKHQKILRGWEKSVTFVRHKTLRGLKGSETESIPSDSATLPKRRVGRIHSSEGFENVMKQHF